MILCFINNNMKIGKGYKTIYINQNYSDVLFIYHRHDKLTFKWFNLIAAIF